MTQPLKEFTSSQPDGATGQNEHRMSAFERVARLGDRFFDRLRHRGAFAIAADEAVDQGLDSLRGHKYAVLVTFRRTGEAVPSPVWFGIDGHGTVFVRTGAHAGKVKRLRRDDRVLIAPSSLRGKPRGPAIRGTGRILPRDEWPHAEETLAAAYGVLRRIEGRAIGGGEDVVEYIEITPSGPSDRSRPG
jgi:PPOX class probable F420-dependent enzyme